MTSEPENTQSPVPPELEERVVRSLRARGLLSRPRGWQAAAPWLLALAAGLLLFAGGMALERSRLRPAAAPSATPRFILLLYGEPASAAEADRDARVEEYRRWIADVARSGHGISGEELAREARVLSGGGVAAAAAEDGPAGYFVFEARDIAEATRIAESCPHLRRGGRAVLRPIRPT